MKGIISQFFKFVAEQKIEIYNEFSLQHELGIFLRGYCPNKKIQFERNVSYFGFEKSKYEKKEIDLVVFSNKNNPDCVVELKYPRNGQYPESMFSFCKDIAFLEQLSDSGFKSAYFIAVVDDSLFYSGNNKQGIYGLFRDEQIISGKIQKPTGKKDKEINIKGSYKAKWQNVLCKTKYCLIEVGGQ
jgi:hypothetical protein